MNQLESKIEAIAKQLEERRTKAASTARMTAVVYGILVIFVFAYTNILLKKIEKEATPNQISALVTNQIQGAIPRVNDKIIEFSERQVPEITEKMIQKAHSLVPDAESFIKKQIDTQVAVFIAETKKDLFPEFMNVLKAHSKEIGEHSEVLTDKVATQEIAKTIVEEISQKIDYDVIGDEFFGKFHELRTNLDELATKPVSQLTRKQLAERNAIMNWMYIVKSGESIQNMLGYMVSNVGLTFHSMADGSFFLGTRPEEVEKLAEEE